MDDLSGYASRPFAFYLRYVRLRPVRHAGIVLTGFAAALCAVGTQYAIKFLVDILSGAAPAHGNPWLAFGLLASLLAADHLLSRISGVIASVTFPLVAADLRSDLFRHLSAQAPRYFADRLPGTLTSRITAASNAVVSLENMFSWNVLPPLVGNIGALAVLASISLPFTAGLVLVALAMVFVIYRLAAAARPLHRLFAEKAASVDGELVDIIGNMAIVRAFGGVARETRRVREALARETGTRRQSLLYMDRLRILHSTMVVIIMMALLAWAIVLWQRGAATTGDVVLVCTLGFSILQATRELAYAFVDVTQHMARLAEAIGVLLQPHEIRDRPGAQPLPAGEGTIRFEHVDFGYPAGAAVLEDFNLAIAPGQRVGLVGESGGGKSTLFALLQRFYDVQGGRILIDGHDIAAVTQASLRQRIAIARAFLKDAPILLLDEATSALDIEAEEAVREALDRLMRGRTVLAIAHRLSTLRGFDRILVLQSGRIVEDGPPDQLMRSAGAYRRLIEREVARLPARPGASASR
jgi:ATP-binding cassette subfamily B protein